MFVIGDQVLTCCPGLCYPPVEYRFDKAARSQASHSS
jgi:hypothetical protein